ncbi:MAG: hypothetical protein QM754_13875 [Tepidisphaeraceae bacterium]
MWDIFDTCAWILDERNRLSRIVATGLVLLAIGLVFAAFQIESHRFRLGYAAVSCVAMAWGFIKLGDWWEAREAAKQKRKRFERWRR